MRYQKTITRNTESLMSKKALMKSGPLLRQPNMMTILINDGFF